MITLKQAYEWSSILGVAGGFLTGCFYIARWVVRWMWRVDSLQTNHLPHIYHLLQKICEKLGIDYTEPEGL